ncbi:hypothetical protein GOP47_0008480 [Adiantum capillus-veneris]|uniref:Uncharacterized protein n=1 Tax=Adiantum capillus-veneris TaxID=13818 RepID=A0A9D4UZ08_ADICA|nr:hypothetical protein GOP47_0008480 [Adiantum capillus-veneris]
MSCLRLSARVSLHEQAQVSVSRPRPLPQATAWPHRPWFSRSVSFAAKKKWIQPAECTPSRREQLRAKEDAYSDNIVVELLKAIFRDLQNGIMFLFEQPKELQYLEFPSLQSAAKMALFTIVVVMVLIVFLATVDSAFSYIMASMFRRIR